MINPQTCTCFRLLGPCFKTGQMKHHHHKLPNVHRHKAQWSKHTVQHMQRLCMSCLGMITPTTAHAPSCSQYWHSKATQTCKTRHTICIHKHRLRKFVRNNASICTLQSWFSRAFHLLSLQQFQVLLTFFSKSFSHFPHGTCLLSVSNQCLALDENYHPFCAPFPRNATLRSIPCMGKCAWHAGVSPSMLLFPKRLACTFPLVMQLHCAIRNQRFQLSTWAVLCSFAITKRILFSLLSSAYLYA